MAGDWIKLRKCLFSHPKVARIARASAMSEPQAVGWLARIWSWADEHTDDGTVANLSLEDVHRLTLAPEKFLSSMRQVGWIVESIDGISFPEFDAHMSESARRREQKTLQKQLERLRKQIHDAQQNAVANLSPSCRQNVVPREEKRRVTKRKYTKKDSANPPEVTDVADYCRERGNHVDPQQFVDYYQARGWKLKGGTTMKDWKAAVRTWERNGVSADGQPKPYTPPSKRRKPKADQIADKRYRLIKAGHNEARDWSDDEVASVDEAALTNQNSDYPNSPQKVAT